MASTEFLIEACPRCGSLGDVARKLLLLDNGTLSQASSKFRPVGSAVGGFTVQGLKPEFLSLMSPAQFIHGLYCTSCGVGFIPESIAKPEAPVYKLLPDGWRRVFPDGTFGPLLESILDDPEASVF